MWEVFERITRPRSLIQEVTPTLIVLGTQRNYDVPVDYGSSEDVYHLKVTRFSKVTLQVLDFSFHFFLQKT